MAAMQILGLQRFVSTPTVRDHGAAFDYRPPDESDELAPRGFGYTLKTYPTHAFLADFDGNYDQGMESCGSSSPSLLAPSNECFVYFDGPTQPFAIWPHHGTSELVQA